MGHAAAQPLEEALDVVEGELIEAEESFEGEVVEPPPPPPPPPVVQPPSAQPPRPRAVPQPRPTRAPASEPIRPVATRDEPAPGEGSVVGGSDLPKTGATVGGPVSFDFDNADLASVISSIAAATGRNFDLDPNIGSTPVTVITHKEIPPEMAFEVLESILSSRGFSMVETLDGNLIKILASPQAISSDKTPLAVGQTMLPDSYDQLRTHIVPVQFADAAELSSILARLGSMNARIDVYVPTNTLIITDSVDGLRRMFAFLESADLPGNETIMEIFTLEYSRAEVIQGQLEQVLLDEAGGAGGAVPGQPQQPRQPVRPTRTVRPTVPGQGPSEIIGSREEVLRMVPDERLNALIVVASEGMMTRVRDLVRLLDTPTPYEANNLHIYELLHADAEQIEEALQGLLGAPVRSDQTAAAGGAGGGGGGGGGAAGPKAATAVFEQEVQVSRFEQKNALIVVASPQDYKRLQTTLAILDVPARQVHVDTVVMDVTITDDIGVTVDTASLGGADGFGLTSTQNISSIYGALLGVSEAANGIALGPESGIAAGAAILGLGNQGGLTAGIFEDLTFNYNGQEIKIPFVPLLFQAIEKLTDVEVLSQPSLLTVDNEEASITVGQEVPFVVGTSQPNTGAEGNLISTGFTRIQREEVGVKLTVTPQISEGDYVALELEVEVSDLDAQQVGTVDILGPTTNKSLINNRVVVKDGGTAVIAGLIRDNKSRDVTQAPVLGDLPLLGFLFRSQSNTRSKRNMVVLVTPTIVKGGTDLDRVTRYKVAEYRDANLDALFERGFFSRVSRKIETRRDYRPTKDRVESIVGTGSTGFGRGDIKR
jgi:general secretion pathway protein D